MSSYQGALMSEGQIQAIGQGLLDCSLPKQQWTHAAHLAAALWLLVARPDIDAPVALPGIIRAYNLACGVANSDTGGYHETITQASLRAVADYVRQQPAGTGLAALCTGLLASPLGDKQWPLNYWSPDCLFSTQARRKWVEPDLQDLPF
ncbi:hypothetical protein [Duganella qianjiadongensis]|nr:hypothetical protein [Duganella qianjiadongensis]